jgi:acyl-CoA thioester hydrolase
LISIPRLGDPVFGIPLFREDAMPHPASHTIEIRVRFGETDPYGVAYFAAVLDYFKRGMDEFLRERGLSPDAVYRNRQRNFGFPVVATACRYRSPVRFDDLLTLRTRIVRLEERGATFGFSLFRLEAGKDILAAEGKVSCRAIDASWKPIPIPKELRKALTGG